MFYILLDQGEQNLACSTLYFPEAPVAAALLSCCCRIKPCCLGNSAHPPCTQHQGWDPYRQDDWAAGIEPQPGARWGAGLRRPWYLGTVTVQGLGQAGAGPCTAVPLRQVWVLWAGTSKEQIMALQWPWSHAVTIPISQPRPRAALHPVTYPALMDPSWFPWSPRDHGAAAVWGCDSIGPGLGLGPGQSPGFAAPWCHGSMLSRCHEFGVSTETSYELHGQGLLVRP